MADAGVHLLLWKPNSLAIVLGEEAYDPAKPVLWAALLLSLAMLCWRVYKAGKVHDLVFVTQVYYGLLFFHVFFPRGIYKYYYASVIPFNSMFIRSRMGVLAFFGLNALILFIPRYLTPWVSILLSAVQLLAQRGVLQRWG